MQIKSIAVLVSLLNTGHSQSINPSGGPQGPASSFAFDPLPSSPFDYTKLPDDPNIGAFTGQNNNNPPQPFKPPSQPYGPSPQSFNTPFQPFSLPSQPFNAPSQSFNSPSQPFNPPPQSYNPSQQSYNPPPRPSDFQQQPYNPQQQPYNPQTNYSPPQQPFNPQQPPFNPPPQPQYQYQNQGSSSQISPQGSLQGPPIYNSQPFPKSAPPPSSQSVPIPEQFRILDGDSLILLQSVKDFMGDLTQANKIVAAENRLGADLENTIFSLEARPVSVFVLLTAQPSVIRLLKNCIETNKILLAKKDMLKYYGGSNYFLKIIRSQYSQTKRMQAAVNAKASALVRGVASAEFNVLYKTLDNVIASW